MKFTTALCTVVLAATVSSVAVPEPVANASPWPPCGKRGQPCKRDPEASPWPPCGKRGQPCKRDAEAIAFPWPPCGARGQPCKREPEAHGVARAAEAFAEAIAEPVPVAEDEVILARCEVVGGACYEARKMTRDLADSIALSARDPEAYLAGIQLETRDEEAIIEREATAIYKREALPWPPCGKRGQPCKRDAEAEAACGAAGQPCALLARGAEAVAEAIAMPWPPCGQRGQPCKREAGPTAEAEAIADVLYDINAKF